MALTDAFRSLRDSGPAGWAVATVVVAQIAVPAVAFFDEPPTPFGFQMFSGHGAVANEAVDEQGNSVDVDEESLVPGAFRPDVDWTLTLPERVCEEIPAVVSVTVVQPDGRRTLQCD